MPTSVVVFDGDFRLADNPALTHAARRGKVVPLYVFAPEELGRHAPGGASRWWMHHSLTSLAESLGAKGVPLIVRRGASAIEILSVAKEAGADRVFANLHPSPHVAARQRAWGADCKSEGLNVSFHASGLLHDPDRIKTGAGDPYTVFTPFYRKLVADTQIEAPLAVPRLDGEHAVEGISALDVGDLRLLPRIDWAAGLRATWTPGEASAQANLARFVAGPIATYVDLRNRPDVEGSSRLSPHLAHGEITPRQAWWAATRAEVPGGATLGGGHAAWKREIGWREFCYHVLHHFPHVATQAMKPRAGRFPWVMDERLFAAFTSGQTGFPLVDAGMRQLWQTGWMHNRVRMVVASFLTKDLHISWLEGADWFWDTLVDADLANNCMGWQWSAGCGADAQPFFRIFHPVSQGERFDPLGDYVRRWVPELAHLSASSIHWPHAHAADFFAGPLAYPGPVVDHARQREKALALFKSL